MKRTTVKISLSRKIFQYLLGAIIFSQVILGAFWVISELNEYRKDVALLKKTYSETKKAEIQNKILKVKDDIDWVRSHPLRYIPYAFDRYQGILKQILTKNPNLNKRNADLITKEQFSIYILNKQGNLTYSYRPVTNNKIKPADEKALLSQLRASNTSKDHGTITLYTKDGSNDSILKAMAYYSNNILPGSTVISVISSECIDNLLQEYLLDSLSMLRFAKDEYIFINSFQGKALVSNGKRNDPPIDILKTRDSSWLNVFKMEQLAATRQGGLFHTYIWQKISASKTAPKTSYFAYIPEWNWIIGTGFYADDVNSIIESKRQILYAGMRTSILQSVLFLLISTMLCYLVVLFFSKKLKTNIEIFKTFFVKAADENVVIDKSKINYKEFERMAEAANLMVDEREKARAAAHKSEEKFLKAFKNSPDAILITSVIEGYIIDANESASRITGYPQEEILGQTTIELEFWVNIEDRNRYIELINKTGRAENFESDLRMKSGEIRIGLFSGEIIQLGPDKYILNVIRDITERRKAEELLKASEERYRFLFEHNPASMLIYERETFKMLAVNEAFLRHYGYSSEEVLSMHLPDLYPEREKVAIVELARNLKGHAYVGEWHHIKKDDTEITVLVTSHDLVYIGRNARIAVITDITERKKGEEELLKTNISLEKAQKMAHLGFLDWDLITNEIIPSEEIYNLYGLPKGKKYETPEFVATVTHPEDVTFVRENLDLALKNIKPYNIDHRIVRPTGEILWVNAQAELVRNSLGNPVRLQGTVMDITERKKASEEIKKLNQTLEERVAERTAQLVAINKELESFSYSISHDLRAPLRAIFGFSQILARRHRESLNEEGRQYMDYIVEASVRMEQLINDLLNYSRLGRKSINIRPVPLNDILETIHSDFKQKLDEIKAQFNIINALPVIQGDESLLRQIFTNLTENAITYRRTNEHLEINISCEQKNGAYLIKFSDNGIGIPEEYWEKIFNIFQRLHSDDQYPGTGIGLATVKKAVTMLSGSVWVTSIIGKGSTFYVNLQEPKL